MTNNDKTSQNSIHLTVRFFATLKEITKQREIKIELQKETTIKQVLESLFDQYESLREEIFTEDNEPREWIQILKNGRNIKFLDGIQTKLDNGDVLAVFPPVAGGEKRFEW
ncbi:MAG: ubiquitin-like small modifier protein 1 [Candidatus Hodarchaeota archaeon]